MRREALLVYAMLVVVVVSTLLHSQFFAADNFSFILADSMVVTFLALGETFVMLGRGIDLSVGSIMGMSAIVVGFLVQDHNLPLVPAVLIAAALGAGLGLGNAILVALVRLPPIIATLGTLTVYSGLEFVVTDGRQVDNVPDSFTNLASTQVVPGVPEILLLTIPFVLVAAFVLRLTVFGRSIYAAGDDAEAAYRAGIPVQRVLFVTYVLAGVLAGVAGVAFLISTSGASSTTGASGFDTNLSAIAAALLGGTALTGGRGGAVGAIVGSIFLSLTLTAMTFAHIDDVWQPAGVGVLVLLAVISDRRAQDSSSAHLPGLRRLIRRLA